MRDRGADFRAWREGGATYRHAGRRIFYRREGTGPELTLIHGFPSASWDWHAVWPRLTERFRTTAPDMIGFGWSDKPRDYRYSIADQATLHEGLLRELGVNRAHLLAHDYGDTVAQELLARYEERARLGEKGLVIESICLLNGGLFPETHRARPVQRMLAGPLGPLVGLVMTRAAFGRGLTEIFGPKTPPSPAFLDELWTLLRHEDGHRVTHHLIGYMAERRRFRERWVGALQTTAVPLRLVDGVADPVSGAHVVARYRELVPEPDTVVLPGIGHYPQVEAPAEVLEAFLAFHRRVTGE